MRRGADCSVEALLSSPPSATSPPEHRVLPSWHEPQAGQPVGRLESGAGYVAAEGQRVVERERHRRVMDPQEQMQLLAAGSAQLLDVLGEVSFSESLC